MPPNELVVVHECDPEPSDLHLIKLAAFMGVPVRGVSLSPTADGQGREIVQVMRRGGCAAVSAGSLSSLLIRSSLLHVLLSMAVQPAMKLFVHGCRHASCYSDLIPYLSVGV